MRTSERRVIQDRTTESGGSSGREAVRGATCLRDLASGSSTQPLRGCRRAGTRCVVTRFEASRPQRPMLQCTSMGGPYSRGTRFRTGPGQVALEVQKAFLYPLVVRAQHCIIAAPIRLGGEKATCSLARHTCTDPSFGRSVAPGTAPMADCVHGRHMGTAGPCQVVLQPRLPAPPLHGSQPAVQRHSFLASRVAGRRRQGQQSCRQRAGAQAVRADLVSPSLFSDALAPLAALASPVIDPASVAVTQAFKAAISSAPDQLQPLLVLAGTDIVTVLQLAPSSETVFRLAVGASRIPPPRRPRLFS